MVCVSSFFLKKELAERNNEVIVVKNMVKGIVLVLLLIGIVSATGIVCTGNAEPNLRTDLYLNCSTAALPSACWAGVFDNSSPQNMVGSYPKKAFSSDREFWYSSDDGLFAAEFYIDAPQYSPDYSYSVELHCVANDSSVNSTTFDFTPITYATPDWLGTQLVWVRDNVGFVFASALVVMVLLMVAGFAFKKMTGR